MLLNLVISVASFVSVNGAPTVQLGKTTVVGLDIPTLQQDFFGGIPYAEPPLGSLRLKAPVLKTTLDSATFHATSFGPACLQIDLPVSEMSEDCMTINVFRPSGTSTDANLPVMFWTYGGGFDSGTSFLYNGSGIVAQSVIRGTPVIYVNFNYRLGPLGFPQGHEADVKGSLNLGLKDQLAALEWVQANIGAFGGDKNKVTAFGESAGAIMTSILFLNSPIASLARAAIFESGTQATLALFTAERREVDWQNFVTGVAPCASLAKSGSTFDCLREANSTELFQGIVAAMAETPEEFPWSPALDGPGGLIPDHPSVLFKRGQFARLPFIIGNNLDEGTQFLLEDTTLIVNTTEGVKETYVSQYSPPVPPETMETLEAAVDTLLKLYPIIPALGSPYDTGNNTFGLGPEYKRSSAIYEYTPFLKIKHNRLSTAHLRTVGDLDFQSQRRIWTETAANAGVPTYGYLFTQPQPNSAAALGVFHSAEIYYVYGAPNNTAPSAILLSRIMTDYWVSFATSLTPNDGLGVPRPEWTQFTPEDKVVIQLNGENLTMIPDDFHAEQIAFINSNPLMWHH
ncbi:extracellular triacylglycerol lipase precursor [Mycena galericulata]|nr:extracellular triacylglycerol lipase precursor [Mycena galericulata]